MRIKNKQKSWNCFLETKMTRHWIHNSALHLNIIRAFSFLFKFRLISRPVFEHKILKSWKSLKILIPVNSNGSNSKENVILFNGIPKTNSIHFWNKRSQQISMFIYYFDFEATCFFNLLNFLKSYLLKTTLKNWCIRDQLCKVWYVLLNGVQCIIIVFHITYEI